MLLALLFAASTLVQFGAAQIQAGLLPNQVPDVEGVDLAGLCLPAESIGGDFYDYIPLPQGKIAIIVADVSGHGLGPALLMAEVRAYIWALAASRGSIAECLMGANRFLLSGTGAGQYFVTAFLAELDPAAGCFTYAAAGHEGYLLNPRGGFTRLASDGLPLGLDEGMCYGQAGVLQLGPGQILALMTDGITEALARDGAFFGVDRAMEIVKRHLHLAARDIVVALYEGVRQFSPGSAPDDRTIVILKSDRGAKLRCSGRRREAISGATCGTL